MILHLHIYMIFEEWYCDYFHFWKLISVTLNNAKYCFIKKIHCHNWHLYHFYSHLYSFLLSDQSSDSCSGPYANTATHAETAIEEAALSNRFSNLPRCHARSKICDDTNSKVAKATKKTVFKFSHFVDYLMWRSIKFRCLKKLK